MRTNRRLETQMKNLMNAAMEVLEANHGKYRTISRQEIADIAGVSAGLVTFYFGDMDSIRAVVLAEAIKRGNPYAAARAILDGHPEAENISDKLRKKVQRLFK